MTYTWGEIQIASLQKMFLNNTAITVASLPTLKTDRKYLTYLNAMPFVANEGLLRIMNLGHPLVKKYTLNKNISDDIFIHQSFETVQVIDEDYVIEGDNINAYYFEIDNESTIKIEQYNATTKVWTTDIEITHVPDIEGTYEVYKDVLTTFTGLRRITFAHTGYMYNVKNIALYSPIFRDEDTVPINTPKLKYDLSTLITDFYKIITVNYEDTYGVSKYTSNFIIEGDNTLIIDAKSNGNFIITYCAFPDKIISTTLDTYVFKTPVEMVALLPLYIASELYKDDDIQLSTIYRNQFEIGLQTIVKTDQPMEFDNNSNWL